MLKRLDWASEHRVWMDLVLDTALLASSQQKKKTTEPAAEKFPPRGPQHRANLNQSAGSLALHKQTQASSPGVGRRVSIYSLYCTYVYFTAHWRGVRGGRALWFGPGMDICFSRSINFYFLFLYQGRVLASATIVYY